MAEPLRILMLEDNPVDAKLVQFELQEAGFIFTSKVVMTEEEFVRELQGFLPDLILSDYDLPQYNGALALAESTRVCPETPFILVTGAVSEDRAIEILIQGAKDYVLKTRLEQRLVPAVRRTLAEADEHRARKQAEAELREAHKTLEERVNIRTAELESEMAARKRQEEALRESEKRVRLITETIDEVFWMADVEIAQILYVSPSFERIWGRSRESLYENPRSFLDAVHAEDRERVLTGLEIEKTGQPFDHEYRIILPDGNVRHIWDRGFPIRNEEGQISSYAGVAMDITNRKRAEDALKESEQRLSDIIDFLPDATFAIDRDGKVITWNRAIEEMTGVKAEDMIGKGDYEYAIPFYGMRRPILIDLVFVSDEEIEKKYRFIEKEGDILFTEADVPLNKQKRILWGKARPLYNSGGNIVGAIESIRDITDRKHTEEALRESERKFRAIFDQTFQFIGLMTVDGTLIEANRTALIFSGIEESDVIGKPFWETPWWTHSPELQRQLCAAIKKAAEGEFVRFEATHHPADGNLRHIDFSLKPVMDEAGNVVLLIPEGRDITDRKHAEEEKRRMEERLQRAEKMEALGTLAGGIAHDLNNSLGIVVGYSEMLLDEVDESSSIRTRLERIRKGGARATEIVQDMLTMARRGVPNRQVLNLNKIITDCQQSPEFEKLSSYHPFVKIKTDLEPDLLNISGSSVHLGKTLYNLISNAKEAMPKGGTLTIKTANQFLDKPIQGYDHIRKGDYVVLAISDGGEGIPPADLKRIFEPFYTKKVMGRRSGTGLGLAVVWGTVKDHNGYINVQSDEGKGSTFTIYFPVTREEIFEDQIFAHVSEYMGNGESILVVDDIKDQCDLAAQMLSKLNYNVVTASSGEEAVAYLKEHQTDLMVLDMIMDPGMDGLDTYRSVLEIYPRQKAIIVSGFSETDRVSAAQKLGAGTYVRKPYVIEKVGLAVRKELDRK